MTRPDFYEGLHPQLDCDLVNKRKIEYMTELEGGRDQLQESLEVAATTIAELAQKNVRQDHAFANEVERGTEWRNQRDVLLAALKNLENDDGSIPEHAWRQVKQALAYVDGP